MSTAFSRTIRLLNADRTRSSALWLLATGALAAGWTVWCVLGQVTLYVVTPAARLEVDRAIYPIQAPMLGRVSATYVAVGRRVAAGEVLVELDTSAERLQVREERTRLEALPPQIEAMRRQIAAEQISRGEEQRAYAAATEEARANARQAEAPAAFSAEEDQRLKSLRAEGLVSRREAERGQADAQQTRFTAERERLAIQRLEREQRTHEADRDARIRSFETEIAKLDGQSSASRATVARLENEIDRRVIRAPIAEQLGEAAALRIGAVLHEGVRVAAVVPEGRLLVIAQFPPEAAMGRIAAGQRAQVRLDGFPWTQYGALRAVVSRVASEVREGTVRVELTPEPGQRTAIPLQHGLPGSVEVTVERITPAALILRIAGRLATSPRRTFGATPAGATPAAAQ